MPLDPATLQPLPSTPALSGVLETLAFFRDPDFARSRFERYGDVYETSLLGQRTVFIRGGQAIGDLFAQGDAVQGWWPDSVRELLGPLSLANRNGADHKARRRVVGQLFASSALKRYSPTIVALVNELSQQLLASDAPVALVPKLRRFAFSVIASTVLGLDPIDREALFVDFETWCQGLFSLPLALPGSPYARARQARQRLLKRLGAVLKKAQAAMASGAPIAAGGLDQDGVADLIRDSTGFACRVDGAGRTGDHGYPVFLYRLFRRHLVAHQGDMFSARSDKGEAVFFQDGGEAGFLR